MSVVIVYHRLHDVETESVRHVRHEAREKVQAKADIKDVVVVDGPVVKAAVGGATVAGLDVIAKVVGVRVGVVNIPFAVAKVDGGQNVGDGDAGRDGRH